MNIHVVTLEHIDSLLHKKIALSDKQPSSVNYTFLWITKWYSLFIK